MYQSTFVKYERKGDRVVPVRVTKQWVTQEVPSRDSRKEPTVKRVYKTVRSTAIAIDRIADREHAPEGWQSSDRVESRERLMGLFTRGEQAEPILQEAGYDQYFLPIGSAPLTAAQARQTLDNQQGGREPWLVLPSHEEQPE